MRLSENHYLVYAIKPNSKPIAEEIQKIFKLLGASTFNVTTRCVTIINEDWSHTEGELWRHEVHGMWYDKSEMLIAKSIVDKWLGGE